MRCGAKLSRMRTQLALLVLAMMSFGVLASYSSDTSYYAGVVEFEPQLAGTGKERLKANKRKMIEIIESKETNGLDILVFPEHVLNNKDMKTFVPPADALIAPCDSTDYDPFLIELSCSARSRQIYLVVNVVEMELCVDNNTIIEGACDTEGLQTFNTNVVFDRKGHVIARYRKTHLYGYEWYSTDVLRTPELSTFTTDFGVTFGQFICFDMLFYVPAMRLVKDLEVTDFIYPTYWFNELPFLTAMQLQEGWAFANDVTLLAAGGSVPQEQNSGSGIYAGRFGRLDAIIVEGGEHDTTTLLKARVPKHLTRLQVQTQKPLVLTAREQPAFVPEESPARFRNLSLLRDYNVDIFTTHALPPNFLSVSRRVCHDKFCCDFDVTRDFVNELDALANSNASDPNWNTAFSYQYRLAAYSGGSTTFQSLDRSDLSVCAIFACTGEHLYTCGHIFPEHIDVIYKHYFTNLTVSGSFREAPHRLIMPSTVDGVMTPLRVDNYKWSEELVEHSNNSQTTNVTISLLRPKTDLLTFGIWANYYTTALTSHNLNMVPEQPKPVGKEKVHLVESSSALSRCTPLAWLIAACVFFQSRKFA